MMRTRKCPHCLSPGFQILFPSSPEGGTGSPHAGTHLKNQEYVLRMLVAPSAASWRGAGSLRCSESVSWSHRNNTWPDTHLAAEATRGRLASSLQTFQLVQSRLGEFLCSSGLEQPQTFIRESNTSTSPTRPSEESS